MTPHNDCYQLEAYLADSLSADATAAFESHLDTCDDCREAVDEQRWIDGLLQSPTRIELEHTPPALLETIRSSVARQERSKLRVTYSLAAAAVVLIGIGWFALREPKPPRDEATNNPTVAAAPEIPELDQAPSPKQQATFVASTDSIVVPVESSSSDVTIVQVYSTTEAERRQRLNTVLSTNL